MTDKDKATLEYDDKRAAQENAHTLTTFFKDLDYAAATLIPDAAVVLSPDRDALAYLLASIRRAAKLLKDADQFVEDELTKVMGGRQHDVAGLGRIEMHSGASRKAFDHDTIRLAVVHSIATKLPPVLVDPGEGVELDPIDVTAQVVDEWRKLGNPSYRVGGEGRPGLRSFGIDPDQVCTVTWGRKTIELPALPDNTVETQST